VAPLFITSMSLIMIAAICFLREVRLASNHLNRMI